MPVVVIWMDIMTIDQSDVHIRLDDETRDLLVNLAAHQKQSISATAAELIREALELHEDVLLSRHADERAKATNKWVSHDDAWS
jgi:predicted DNA-binding protein